MPFYCGITRLPKAWKDATAYEAFRGPARRLSGTARILYLNKYSAACARHALHLARSLPARMR